MYADCLHLFIFFFNDTATTEIYTLSLHDALPISPQAHFARQLAIIAVFAASCVLILVYLWGDRKSTRLNSSHCTISYAVFCLKKKTQTNFHSIHYTQKQKKQNKITTP